MSKTDKKLENNTELACATGLGFSKRDENVREEETKGNLEFKTITNDGKMKNLKLLTALKNIIAKQLPKMPKEYIVRLVFDKRHESMIIIQKEDLKNGKKERVLGGICYRPNKEQKFIEIAFLAISSLEQVKGYGTRLMNKLKDKLKNEGIKYFLTYADNNAIGYFKKQGFDKSLKLPSDQWKGYIKDYDGGTLMEAACNEAIDYSNLSSILKQEKEKLQELGAKFLNKKKKYTFDDLEKSFQKNNIDITKINITNDTIIPENVFNAIPGLLESGWSYELYQAKLKEQESMTLLEACRELLKKLKAHTDSWPFYEQLDKISGYSDKIKNPINFHILDFKLEKGEYKTADSFVNDIKVMFDNCITFNGRSNIYGRIATSLGNEFAQELQALKDKYPVQKIE